MDGIPITKRMLQANRTIYCEEETRKFILHWTKRICSEVVQTSKTTDECRYVWACPVKVESTELLKQLVKSLEQQIEDCKIVYSNNEITIDWS
jgi:hypothetical protein